MAEYGTNITGKLPISRVAPVQRRKKGRRKKTDDEKQAQKKEIDRARNKTRINIGVAFQRWRELRVLKRFRSDAQLATFLLDKYHRGCLATSAPNKRRKTTHPNPVLSSNVSGSSSDQDDDSEEGSEVEETPVQVFETTVTALDIHGDIDERDFNHIQNTNIDWAEDRTKTPHEDTDISTPEEEETIEEGCDCDDLDEEEDYIPPFCVRPADAMQQMLRLDALQAISTEETVHDTLDSKSTEFQTVPETLQVQREYDIIVHPAAITYHACLKQLAQCLVLPIPMCTAKDPLTFVECRAPGPFQIQTKSRGTAVIMQWICQNNHCVWQWNSQPTFKDGTQAGDFLLASNIILSGNNYTKVALLFRFMNMGMVERSAFFKIQDSYCVDAIKDFWNKNRAEVISRLQSKDSVVVLADGCMDSPGVCAQYCTYTMMENDTKEVLSIVNVDKRETQRSPVFMEKEGFIRSFDQLHQEVKLAEVCTDAPSPISALFDPVKGKYKDSRVLHTLDMWHGSKDLGKKIHAAAQQTGCSILLQWIKDICNHFWFCCKTSENYDDFYELWSGLLRHVTGEEEWSLDGCQDGPLEEPKDKTWIEKGSVAYQALSEVILNKSWLKEVHKYLHFRSTAELESFHNHILLYASKHFSFSPPEYEARILLAGLDYNHHVHRPPKRRPDGSIEYRKLYNKKSRKWSLYAIKQEKDYRYIPEIQRAILKNQGSTGFALPQLTSMRPNGPRQDGVPFGVPSGVSFGLPSGVAFGVLSGVQFGVPTGVPFGVPSSVPSGVPTGVPSSVPTGVLSGVPIGVPSSVPAPTTQELMETQVSRDQDEQQLLKVNEEEVPRVSSSNLDQQNPELLHMKEEEEELQNPELLHMKEEGEELQNPELLHMKEEEEKLQNPELLHMKEEGEELQNTQLLHVKEEEEKLQNPELLHMKEEEEKLQNPELVHIKKEEEELQCSEEGEQLPVKSEDEEKPQLFQLHQIKTKNNRETETPTSSSAELMKRETDGEDCGGPEPDKNRSPNTNLQPITDERASDSSETEDSNDFDKDENMSGSGSDNEDSDEDWRETRTPGSEPPASCSAEQMKTKTDGEDCVGLEPGPGRSQANWQLGDLRLLKVQVVLRRLSYSLDQQNPELLHIKKEEKELQCSEEGEQLPVEREDDEKPQLFQLHQIKTKNNRETETPTSSSAELMKAETDGEDCGGPEPDRNQSPNTNLQPNTDERASDFSETEDSNDYDKEENMSGSGSDNEDSDEDWRETRTPGSEPPASPAEQMKTKTDGKACRDPEPDRTHDPNTDEKTSDILNSEDDDDDDGDDDDDDDDDYEVNMSSSVSENEDSDEDWSETSTLGSGVKSNSRPKSAEKSIRCTECCQQFVNKQALQKHMTSHSTESSSGLVDKRSKMEINVKSQNVNTGENQFDCVECGKKIKNQATLKKHMRVHTGEKPFSCDQCNKAFSHVNSFKAHMMGHSGEQQFQCEVCDKRFRSDFALKQHMQIHKGKKLLACSKCDRRFRLRGDLDRHMMSHTGVKPFVCCECGAQFSREGTLRLHAKLHTGDKTFVCEKCDKRYTRKSHFRRHMLFHTKKGSTKETPFACKYCKEVFDKSELLTAHLTVHQEQRPFACDKCNDMFSRSFQLKRHMKVHLKDEEKVKDKPFICKDCGKAFAVKAHITAHMSIHTGVKPFSCHVCGSGFTRKESLKSHISNLHKK